MKLNSAVLTADRIFTCHIELESCLGGRSRTAYQASRRVSPKYLFESMQLLNSFFRQLLEKYDQALDEVKA